MSRYFWAHRCTLPFPYARSSANRIAIAMIPSGTDALNEEAAIPNRLPSRCRAPGWRPLAVRGHAVAGVNAVEHRMDGDAKAFSEARVSTHRGLAGAIEVARERKLDQERARGIDVPSRQRTCDRQRAPVAESCG